MKNPFLIKNGNSWACNMVLKARIGHWRHDTNSSWLVMWLAKPVIYYYGCICFYKLHFCNTKSQHLRLSSKSPYRALKWDFHSKSFIPTCNVEWEAHLGHKMALEEEETCLKFAAASFKPVQDKRPRICSLFHL